MQKKEERMDIAEVLARRRPQRIAKRAMDIVLSAAALAVLWPLLLLIALAVVIDDPGPVFYRQVRIGRGGKPFRIFKFRTMVTDADKKGLAITVGRDSRITRVGAILRKTKLDELAQLLNVLAGQMSFVGPRPERRFFVDKIMYINPAYALLYQLRPGLFSAATLYNGYTDTMEKMLRRLEYDLYYLGHRSWWFDFKVLFNTFCSIVFGKKF